MIPVSGSGHGYYFSAELLLIDWLQAGSAFLSNTSAAELRAPQNLRPFSPFDDLTVRGINTNRARPNFHVFVWLIHLRSTLVTRSLLI